MKNYVIVIGRQLGSLGLEIGAKLAEKLGIPVYGKDIMILAAKKQGISAERLQAMDENLNTNWLVNIGLQATKFRTHDLGALYDTDISSIISENQSFEWQAEVIKKLADKGPCVIVGRCADYILRDHPGLISIFISAPLAVREEWLRQMNPDSTVDIPKLIQKTDKSRERYYNFHTGRKWGDPENYHLYLDASKLGIDGTADFLADYVNRTTK